jgi:hypothetical protein
MNPPPLSKRRPLEPNREQKRILLKEKHDEDKYDPFVTDPNPEISEVGRMALRIHEDVNYLFWLADLCAEKSITPDDRLRVFYVGKALIAYQRTITHAQNEVDRLKAQQILRDYVQWLLYVSTQRPSQRNIAVVLWAIAREDDDALPTLTISPKEIQRLLSAYQKTPNIGTSASDSESDTLFTSDLDPSDKTQADGTQAVALSDASMTHMNDHNDEYLSESIILAPLKNRTRTLAIIPR